MTSYSTKAVVEPVGTASSGLKCKSNSVATPSEAQKKSDCLGFSREQRASPARAGPAARANPARANPAQPEPAQPQPAQPDCPPLTFQHSAGTAHPTPAQPSPPQPSPAQPSPAQPTRYLASQGGAAQGTCHSIRSDLIEELRTGPGILDQSGAAQGSS